MGTLFTFHILKIFGSAGWTTWLRQTGWWLGLLLGWNRNGKRMVCDVAVCHLKPRERTHSQHTCDPCFNRKALIILARSSRAPGTGPGQYASLSECSDNNRLFLSVVARQCCCFHKTLSEPICSSSPLFPPTFWNYPLTHSSFSLSTYIWSSIERLLHPQYPTASSQMVIPAQLNVIEQ